MNEKPAPVIPVTSCVPDEDDPDGARMSLGDHIEELRRRLIRCLLAAGLLFVLGWIFYRQLFVWTQLPLHEAARLLAVPPENMVTFWLRKPMEGFLTVLGLITRAALLFASPYCLYELWGFVRPGLNRRERAAVVPIFLFGSFMFILGVAVAFFFAAPLGLVFCVGFDSTLPGVQERWSPEYYYAFVFMVCFGFGICFETPLVMMALTRAGILNPPAILQYWRHVVLGIFVVAAIATPPDLFTQLVLGSCMVALYFLGYGLSRRVVRDNADGDRSA